MTEQEWKNERLKDAIQILEEARDAISYLSIAQCKIGNIKLDLANRMDEIGTRKYKNSAVDTR